MGDDAEGGLGQGSIQESARPQDWTSGQVRAEDREAASAKKGTEAGKVGEMGPGCARGEMWEVSGTTPREDKNLRAPSGSPVSNSLYCPSWCLPWSRHRGGRTQTSCGDLEGSEAIVQHLLSGPCGPDPGEHVQTREGTTWQPGPQAALVQ